MSFAYQIPAEKKEAEIVIQKSRFIAQTFAIESRERVNSILRDIRLKHPKASHSCYAFIAGAPYDTQAYGFSDDGEPNGTAGKPMLNVLMHSGLGQILVVVTRYFGGIKLGTGGLVRAYTDATNAVLSDLETTLKEEKTSAELLIAYSMEPLVRNHLEALGVVFTAKYSDHVLLTLALTAGQRERLADLLSEHNLQLQ